MPGRDRQDHHPTQVPTDKLGIDYGENRIQPAGLIILNQSARFRPPQRLVINPSSVDLTGRYSPDWLRWQSGGLCASGTLPIVAGYVLPVAVAGLVHVRSHNSWGVLQFETMWTLCIEDLR